MFLGENRQGDTKLHFALSEKLGIFRGFGILINKKPEYKKVKP